jgi:hypothetical protein
MTDMGDPLVPKPGETRTGSSPRMLWYSVALCAVAAAAAYWWYSAAPKERPQARVHLPFASAEQAYASALHVEGIALERTENYLHQEVTTIKGSLVNSGERSVQRVELSVEFQDDMNQVVLRHSFISAAPQPLAPNGTRDLEISLEHIPAAWNRQAPVVRIAGLEFAPSR